MATNDTSAPDDPLHAVRIRDLIAELAHTEDILRGCRADSVPDDHRGARGAARRRQVEIVGELTRRRRRTSGSDPSVVRSRVSHP